MSQETKVLYNAECPVCSWEINHYADYSDKHALPIQYDDLNQCDMARWGLTRDQAAKRLYVMHKGALLSGIPAFIVLWNEMPRYKWLAKLVGLPGIKQIAALKYDYVLAPLIYQWHLLRQRKAKA